MTCSELLVLLLLVASALALETISWENNSGANCESLVWCDVLVMVFVVVEVREVMKG